ncbi:RDD family protein [Flavobacterium sufflavum]|uniref:RDD family protein n=1 Tax=Flavobacterium sufflavum TaxID=1921138 RepID=A0A3S2UNQ2_9FLAO|nr:RDD family protein [Flavobacterium sufflavum]RVT75766.1 RDD family protein [Flavobacterium sufflavum]
MSELSINTTQNVLINFKTASVGERVQSYFIDLLIKIAYGITVYVVFFYGLGFSRLLGVLDPWSRMALIFLFYFPIVIYSMTLEALFEGQTLGKKIVKIKVVKVEGYQAGFGDYLMRWFFRLIDISIFSGVFAFITIVSSKKNQRLGDMVAGTAVISLKNKINISHTILEEIGNEYQPKYPLVIKFSDNDMRIIKENFQRAEAINDYETISKLAAKIESFSGIKNECEGKIAFIKTILKDYNYYTQNM